MILNAYTRLYLWLCAHRPLVLGLTALVTLGGIALSSRIVLEEDILATLPQHDRLVDDYRYALRKFRQIDRVYIDVGVQTDDPDKLGQAADAVHAALAANPDYARIMYRFEVDGQRKAVGFLTGALPNLFTEADAKALAAQLEPGAVRGFLTTMRRKLAGPEGMVLKDIVAADPVGASGLVFAKVLPLQTGFGDGQIVDGRIVSGDGRHVLMLAEPRIPSSDSGACTALVEGLMNLVREVEARFPGVHVAVTGGHRMTVDNASLIKKDATRCVMLGMVSMLVLCLAAYRRRWLSLVTFLPSVFGTLMAGVVLALGQGHLSAIATGFATIAIGITVDYAIHVIYHLDGAAGLDRASIGRHLGHLVLPIGIGALTTVAAFGVMAFSSMHGYQQLGLFGTIGVLCSAAFALVILPLLVPVPKAATQAPLWLTGLMERFSAWRGQKLGWVLMGFLALSIASCIGLGRLRFEGDIAKLNGITASTRQDDALIRKTWGETLSMSLVVARGATVEDALRQNDRAAETLEHVAGVAQVYSLSAICPSAERQRENLKRWDEFWTAPRRDALRRTLAETGAGLGFRAEAFAPFWQRLEMKPALLTLESFRGTPLEQVLSERVAEAPGDTAVSTLLKLKDRTVVQRLRDALPDMLVLDQGAFAQHIAGLARQGLGGFAFWTVLLVALIVYFSLTSIELVIATLLPIAVGLLWTFGAMGWLGLPIDMMNSVFVIFVIGVGEDYSVFLVTSKLDEWHGRPQRMAATSASVLISALTTIFGFGVLAFAQHPLLFSMGTTVLLGMTFSFLATLILTPLCMNLLLFNDPPRGAPRLWHLSGTVWLGLQLLVCEVFLYYVLRPALHLCVPRAAAALLRRATRFTGLCIVKWFPFGRLEFKDITPATLAPPAILISNHQSAVDVLLMVSLPGDVRQTAKKRVFDTPILGIGCKLLGHVMVEPNAPEITLQRCRDRLAEGASVHFYPEGTRSADGFLQRFHRGAFELAVELRQDVLPVILCDTWTAMPRDAYWLEPYHVTVRALPRITPQTFDYSLGSLALMRHCEAIVRAGLQRELDQVNTPAVVRRKVQRLYRYHGKYVEMYVHWKMRLDPFFPELDRVVPRRGFILDLGCGYGVATHWLAQFTDERSFLGIDYDEDRIRVARRTAPGHRRIRFEPGDIQDCELPSCDAILLLDVLHYWRPERQDQILARARRALRPGGRLVLRDAARQENRAHRRVAMWERFATGIGHNKTEEGLFFRSLDETEAALRAAGFHRWELRREAGRDSNVLWVAEAGPAECCDGQTP